jgi:hypothetical protein
MVCPTFLNSFVRESHFTNGSKAAIKTGAIKDEPKKAYKRANGGFIP